MGEDSSAVKSFYRGCNVFVTGATGFVGMALLEKLLRVCPDVGNIYLLMRAKRGKSPTERLQALIKDPVYETLVERYGDGVFAHLVAVSGDVSEENLGLSAEDRRTLVENVNVVFHSAATLDFQTPLKPTVATNLEGTRRVIQLCREMRHLKAMVHVSSAYVNSNRKSVDEILYPVEQNADKLIELTKSLSDESLEALTPKLLGDLPNPYALTKALAEHEVNNASSSFPCVVVRPSMITAAWKDPVPGWTNSKNGPTGFLMGASKGVLRRLPVDVNLIYDYIPVDVVVNAILVAAWHVATTRPNTMPIFHCTSSTQNPFRWSLIEGQINTYLHRFPLKSAVWYPSLKLLPSLTMFRIAALFVHFIPAYILDTVARVTGGKPILVRLHTNVNNSLSLLAPFIFNEWLYDNTHMQSLSKSLSMVDQQLFFLDISTLQWEPYFVSLAQGVRRYLNNEHPSSIPSAQRKDKILFGIHTATQIVLFCFMWWIFATMLNASLTKVVWLPLIVYLVFNIL